MSQYIGKTISLVSNSNIRYVGTLHEINSEQSTVSLKQVRSYGTEGRRGGVDEIPPSEGVYEFIIFRGSDVKDLKIAESPAPPPPQPPQLNDPAILQQTAPAQQQHVYPAADSTIPAPQNYAYPAQQQPQQQQPQQPKSEPQRQQEQPGAPPQAPPQENVSNGGGRARGGRRGGHRGPAVPQNEFDFAQSNAKFVKDEQEGSVIPPAPTDTFYNRTTSFFDNISSTAKERAEGDADNMTPYERRGEERKLNMETFGQPAAYHRGRGRGRGGRGRGRGGRGRGFHNNNNQQ